MRVLLVAGALVASFAAFLVTLAIGLFLLSVEQSGERGAGALLAAGGTLSFGAALFLAFAPKGYFLTPLRRPLGIAAALVALVPVVTLAWVGLTFAGHPLQGRAPLIDWSAFGIGAGLALGAALIAVLGLWRVTGRG
jgi:hypothetical protein